MVQLSAAAQRQAAHELRSAQKIVDADDGDGAEDEPEHDT
jgi:hypothetical protein